MDSPLGRLLFAGPFQAIADSVARQAGALDTRMNVEDLLPGADPHEGMFDETYRPDVTNDFGWLEPGKWAGATPENMDQVIDMSTIPAPGSKVVDGSGMDFFRSSEAPSNYSNRHNPLYQARADFAASMAGQIEELFDVHASGKHYLRPPLSSDAAKGGRSANSDHYSAGAIDFYGDPAQLDALRHWLVDQPFVSFVRWRSESHHDHLHASFDIGWVAQNFYKGREVPTLSSPPSPLTIPREPSERPGDRPKVSTPATAAGRPV